MVHPIIAFGLNVLMSHLPVQYSTLHNILSNIHMQTSYFYSMITSFFMMRWMF